jgi:hypothetical protein
MINGRLHHSDKPLVNLRIGRMTYFYCLDHLISSLSSVTCMNCTSAQSHLNPKLLGLGYVTLDYYCAKKVVMC